MKTSILFLLAIVSFAFIPSSAQSQDNDEEIKTLFKRDPIRASGGYGAISNKLTTLDGHFANMVEMYGGWYVNHRFLIGASASATTNNIPVPAAEVALPGTDLSYEYGQVGLMTEYVLGSNRTFHVVFNMTTGAGFTVQYDRYHYQELSRQYRDMALDENWFFVVEPGVQVEMNVFKWMRFSPGYSYRSVYGSKANGLSDKDLSGSSLNFTLKFGKF